MKKQWVFNNCNNISINKIIEQFNISPLTASVLQCRSDLIADYIGKTFDELIEMLHSPYLLNDMEEAVTEIESAVYNGEKITVYGDYDADGVTATALLYTYLETIGADVDYYIPDRLDEGYGINQEALLMLYNKGTRLIITVDTGISAKEQIDYANSLGMRVVVTDHHQCPEILPDCVAVINPKRPDSTYPFKELAGVGVAFKLVCALNDGAYDIAENFIDLVCIGTIADVMPLINENRAIAMLGLSKLKNTDNLGLNALINKLGLNEKPINSTAVSFMIAPRINACGRLYNAGKVCEMLITESDEQADSIAQWLCDVNVQRQQIETKIYNEAVSIIEQNKLNRDRVIVLANYGWHHGVIGIVASKLCDKYYRPIILLSVEGDEAKGSARSIPGFDIYDGLTNVSNALEKFGGHSGAAGLSLKTSNIDLLRNEINKYAAGVTKNEDYIPKVTIDSVVEPLWLTLENVAELSMLEPFGNGNTMPIFAFLNTKIENSAVTADNKHLRLRVSLGNTMINVVGFGMGDYYKYINIGDYFDICGSLSINEYNGNRSIQIILKDIRRPMGKEGQL